MDDWLLGEWRCADGFSSIVIAISKQEHSYVVRVTDEEGEAAEIYDTREDNGALRFCAHWSSNGRFVKYRLLPTDAKTLDVSYTYSTQETWLKQT